MCLHSAKDTKPLVVLAASADTSRALKPMVIRRAPAMSARLQMIRYAEDIRIDDMGIDKTSVSAEQLHT